MPPEANETLEEDVIDLAAETLTGDVRDHLLERLKHLPKPWQKMSESQQRGAVQEASDFAGKLVRKMARLIASGGQESIPVELISMAAKDTELKMTFKTRNEDEHLLFGRHNPVCTLVKAGAKDFEGERTSAKSHVQPDQSSLLADDEDQPVDAPVMDQTAVGEAVEKETKDPAGPQREAVEHGVVDPKVQEYYDAGLDAFKRNEPESNNPHNKRTKRAKAWAEGWTVGKNAKLQFILEVPTADADGHVNLSTPWTEVGRFESLDEVVENFVGYCSTSGQNSTQRAEILAGNNIWYAKATKIDRLKKQLAACVKEGEALETAPDDGTEFEEEYFNSTNEDGEEESVRVLVDNDPLGVGEKPDSEDEGEDEADAV